jgi:hypothetical protein
LECADRVPQSLLAVTASFRRFAFLGWKNIWQRLGGGGLSATVILAE